MYEYRNYNDGYSLFYLICHLQEHNNLNSRNKETNMKKNYNIIPPLNKKDFVACINKIQDVDRKIEAISDVLRENSPDSIYCPPSLHDQLIEILKKIFREDGKEFSLIEYYVYELKYGEEWREGSIIIDGKSIVLKTPEDLYELLLDEMNQM